jgi:putative ABC transport system substrate-binding protein
MVVQFSALTFEERWRVTALAARFRLPAAYGLREYAEAGGLISYGPTIRDNFERAAVLVDRQDPARCQPGRIAVRAADPFRIGGQPEDRQGARSLTIPPLILARADEVIE